MDYPIILGVTGSIGSGKSFACEVLKRFSFVRSISSDEIVHMLYENDEDIYNFVHQHYPSAIEGGSINRNILGDFLFQEVARKAELESIIYPKLAFVRSEFVKKCRREKSKLIVFEMPLLFENGLQGECDYVLTIYCNKLIQKKRVLRRNKMTEEKFENILSFQMPVIDKLLLSDFSINSGGSKADTSNQIKSLVTSLVF